MNNITITGVLGKDLEIKSFGENVVGNFSVADSQGKDKNAIWWNCSLFGKRAESLKQYLLKGTSVTVFGSITEREWTAKDGTKNKSFDLRVSDVALQGAKPTSSKSESKSESKSNNDYAKAKYVEKSKLDDEEIPF